MKFFAAIALLATFSVASASLAQDLAGILALLGPTFAGLDAGLQQGAGNLKSAVQNVGAAAQQAANGAADVVADGAAGAGQTLGQVPGRVFQTVQTLDNSPGVVGSADRALLGGHAA